MSVGFLYTVVVRRLSVSLVTDVSRKGVMLSLFISMVK